jgi:hypothetical protein
VELIRNKFSVAGFKKNVKIILNRSNLLQKIWFLLIAKTIFLVRKMKTILFNTSFILIVFFPLMLQGQNVIVKGYITNEKSEKKLENVRVFESNSVIGTLTDSNGYYFIILPLSEIKLLVTLDGFQDLKKQMTLKNDTILSIQLKPVENLKSLSKRETIAQASATKKIKE